MHTGCITQASVAKYFCILFLYLFGESITAMVYFTKLRKSVKCFGIPLATKVIGVQIMGKMWFSLSRIHQKNQFRFLSIIIQGHSLSCKCSRAKASLRALCSQSEMDKQPRGIIPQRDFYTRTQQSCPAPKALVDNTKSSESLYREQLHFHFPSFFFSPSFCCKRNHCRNTRLLNSQK